MQQACDHFIACTKVTIQACKLFHALSSRQDLKARHFTYYLQYGGLSKHLLSVMYTSTCLPGPSLGCTDTQSNYI